MMKIKYIPAALLMVLFAALYAGKNAESVMNTDAIASIRLHAESAVFEIDEVPKGAVIFTAEIRNEGSTTLTIAHPSICFPAARKQGKAGHIDDSRGKSEILLKIRKPDGSHVVLRDGHLHYFDPGNFPLLIIPPKKTGTFHIGWFFRNARGRWEQDDEAAKVFLAKGDYKVGITFRNVFSAATFFDEGVGAVKSIEVWTGEMESAEISVEVR